MMSILMLVSAATALVQTEMAVDLVRIEPEAANNVVATVDVLEGSAFPATLSGRLRLALQLRDGAFVTAVTPTAPEGITISCTDPNGCPLRKPLETTEATTTVGETTTKTSILEETTTKTSILEETTTAAGTLAPQTSTVSIAPETSTTLQATVPSQCHQGRVVVNPDNSGYKAVDVFFDVGQQDVGVHVAGTYEADGRHGFGRGHPQYPATVDFTLPGRHVLVVSSYEPIKWTVNVGPETELLRILAYGYHAQEVIVNGSPTTPVLIQSYDQSESESFVGCGYTLPKNDGGCDIMDVFRDVEAQTQLKVSSFHGMYNANHFRFGCDNVAPGTQTTVAQTTVAQLPTVPPTLPPGVATRPRTTILSTRASTSAATTTTTDFSLPVAVCGLNPQGRVVVNPDNSGYKAVDVFFDVGQQDVGVHVAGTYEADGSHGFGRGHPQYPATVDFTLPGRHVLVVSSYEPIKWTVNVGPETELLRILAYGYHAQEVIVNGSPTTPVLIQSYDQSESESFVGCGYTLPKNDGGCDIMDVFRDVEAQTQLKVSSFHGMYNANHFRFGSQDCEIPSKKRAINNGPVEFSFDLDAGRQCQLDGLYTFDFDLACDAPCSANGKTIKLTYKVDAKSFCEEDIPRAEEEQSSESESQPSRTLAVIDDGIAVDAVVFEDDSAAASIILSVATVVCALSTF